MNLEFELFQSDEDGSFETAYVKLLEDNTELCNVRLLDEQEEGNNNIWHRYQLKCKHIMHTRCARSWFCRKKYIMCPLCDEKPTEKHKYCKECDEWGHCCNLLKERIISLMFSDKKYKNDELKQIIHPLLEYNDPKHVILNFLLENTEYIQINTLL